jgi:O-antigen/teichoic acid export membrane protein
MPIGSALMALGRRRTWSAVQFICVVLSAVLDPLLIPWFQSNYANGGLGVCVANVISELVMVAAGLAVLPRGIVDASLGRTLLITGAAGVCMAAIAVAMGSWSAWIAAPCALLGCAAVMWFSGEIRRVRSG